MWHTLSIHGAFWSPDEAEFAAKIEEVRTELGHWEKYLSKTQYLAGAAFTLADVYAGTPYALQKPMKDSSTRHACCESCSSKCEPSEPLMLADGMRRPESVDCQELVDCNANQHCKHAVLSAPRMLWLLKCHISVHSVFGGSMRRWSILDRAADQQSISPKP